MAKVVSAVFGVVFILIAALGFFMPGGTSMEADPARAPHVLGLFPVNLLHNIVHLLFGIWGLLSARTWGGAIAYCRGAGIIYLVLAALGFVAPSGFGFVPLGGHDIWLHAVIGVVLTAVGFTAPDVEPVRTAPSPPSPPASPAA